MHLLHDDVSFTSLIYTQILVYNYATDAAQSYPRCSMPYVCNAQYIALPECFLFLMSIFAWQRLCGCGRRAWRRPTAASVAQPIMASVRPGFVMLGVGEAQARQHLPDFLPAPRAESRYELIAGIS